MTTDKAMDAMRELVAADKEYDVAEQAWDELAPNGIGEMDYRRTDCDEWKQYNAASLRRQAAMQLADTALQPWQGENDGR